MSAKDEVDVGRPPVPTTVRRSSLPNPESTRTPVGDVKDYRKNVESKISKVEEEPKEEVREVFSRSDEPEVKGTIVITVFKNHPYEVELSGNITGLERDLAVKFLYKEYRIWKNKQAKERELEIKNEMKEKEEEDARN